MRGWLAIVVLGLMPASSASADALPPPRDCPAGEIWVQSHSGGCKQRAPENCAPGWRGVVGGRCFVHEAYDGECKTGLEAREVSVCFETYEDRGNGRVYYDPPRIAERAVGIVGASATCEGEKRAAKPAKICLRADEQPEPFVTELGGDGPRRAGLFGKRSACAGGGVELGLGLMAALALLVSRVVRAR